MEPVMTTNESFLFPAGIEGELLLIMGDEGDVFLPPPSDAETPPEE